MKKENSEEKIGLEQASPNYSLSDPQILCKLRSGLEVNISPTALDKLLRNLVNDKLPIHP